MSPAFEARIGQGQVKSVEVEEEFDGRLAQASFAIRRQNSEES